MSKSVSLHRGAQQDFDTSFNWYARRSERAAVAFAQEVDRAIDRIQNDPQRFPCTARDCQYCALERFPFRIIFYEGLDAINVIAIAHAKRRSSYWRGRR